MDMGEMMHLHRIAVLGEQDDVRAIDNAIADQVARDASGEPEDLTRGFEQALAAMELFKQQEPTMTAELVS